MPDPTVHAATGEATRRVRVAARALARSGLVHAYGHCSIRMSPTEFLVSPPRPLGLVGLSDIPVPVATTGALPPGALPEVIAHQHIYRQREDVCAVARFQSPHVTALSALGRTPRALHGFGAYFAPRLPLHSDPRLVRDDVSAASLAGSLGAGRGIVMRGNGAITVGATLEEAVALAWYLEDAARLEMAALSSGLEAEEYTPEEARERAAASGRLFERMWDWMTAGDPEL